LERGEFSPRPKKEIDAIVEFFQKTYPNARCGLNFKNPYELLMATILSAQCQDKTVNLASARLFANFPDLKSLAGADLAKVEDCVRVCGFFREKAKNLIACAKAALTRFNGKVPETLEELVTLRGVGRKTANVVLGEAFGVPGLTVDTHVKRISLRLNLTASQSPDQIERDLMEQIPESLWIGFSRQVIAHGRTLCFARKPKCGECALKLCQARVAV
jgi:endonuclease-3